MTGNRQLATGDFIGLLLLLLDAVSLQIWQAIQPGSLPQVSCSFETWTKVAG